MRFKSGERAIVKDFSWEGGPEAAKGPSPQESTGLVIFDLVPLKLLKSRSDVRGDV